MRTWTALAAAAALAGCNSSTAVRQNGLIPRPRLDTYDGQPMPHTFEIEGHVETTATTPQIGTDSSTGATVARTEYGGALRFPVGLDSEVGFMLDVASPNGAVSASPSQSVSAPTESSVGVGGSLRHSVPLGDPADPNAMRLGLAATFEFWSIQRVEDSGYTGADVSAIGALSIVPSKRFGNVVVFGSATVMNQIGVPAAFIVGTGTESDTSTSPTTFGGGTAVAFGAGARFDAGDNASFVVEASQTIAQEGGNLPMITGAVIFGAGHRPTQLSQQQQPPPYGPPYAQPPPYAPAPPPYAPAPPPYAPAPPPYAPAPPPPPPGPPSS